MFEEQELIKAHKDRLDKISIIIIVCFSIVLARLWYLQVYKGQLLLEYSLQNRLRKENVPAPRGMIFSRNNKLLVDNIPRFDAVIIPQFLKNKDETLEKLAKILDLSVGEIEKTLKKNQGPSYRSVIIKKNISRKEVAIIETENSSLPGISVETFISREYVDKEVGAHVLGYISEISQKQLPKYRERDNIDYKLGDFIGQFGLEEELDRYLRGDDGYEFVEVDALGRKKRHISTDNFFKGIENRPSRPGNNVRLTIDSDLQQVAYDALGEEAGAVVAIDVRNGEVLAMVSKPSFDPSQFGKGLTSEYWASLINNERNPLRDRAIQEHYPPGSTFKTITAIAALEEGIVTEDTEFTCRGSFQLGRRTFNCWRKYGHGKVNVYKALKESCDVFFYRVAVKLDIDVLADYAHRFGFGVKSGINLPREIPGLIPTKEWKLKKNKQEWQLGETLSCVIGQSYVLSTPLQLANAYAAIANGGTLYRPYVVKKVFSNNGDIVEQYDPKELIKTNISPKTMKIIKEGLYKVVNEVKGTAYYQRGKNIFMSGKTGTSQVMAFNKEKLFAKCSEKDYKHRHHALFVAYAPNPNPEIAVSAVVEHGCSGSGSAAPVVRKVITKYMHKYHPKKFSKGSEAL